jgi:hypothetical protein
MNKHERKKAIEEFSRQLDVYNFKEATNRARAVTIGTAFGGTCEISMRRTDGTHTFAILQPVEVIELIHQLAANVGCHINLAPRRDFGSWRDWRVSEEERSRLSGHPPFANDMAPHMLVGANLPHPEQQPGMPMREDSGGETVAVEAPKQQRKSKRAADAS